MIYRFLFNRLIKIPERLPKIPVIMVMGMRDMGWLNAIMTAVGTNTKNETINPFNAGCTLILVLEIKKPITIHIKKAERLASHAIF